MPSRPRITGLPGDDRSRHRAIAQVAMILEVPLASARALLRRLPAALPLRCHPEDGEALLQALTDAGAQAELVAVPDGVIEPCIAHPGLIATFPCEDCSTLLCEVCRGLSGGASRCEACRLEASRSKRFFRVRLALLLTLLAGVCLYAWADIRSRSARTSWERSLHVAVVLLQQEPVSAEAREAFRHRKAEVEQQLASEFARHRSGSSQPFFITVVGPVQVASPPPEPESDGLVDLVQHTIRERGYLSDVHDRADAFDADAFDSRIYVLMKPGTGSTNFVEGRSQQGGRLGVVRVDLRADMVDFAWFVVAHELFHTLGATDKYDASGRALVPSGLADPDQAPPFPQINVEIMGRNRPLDPAREVAPTSLDQLRVNRYTALEIGWLTPR